VFITQAPDPKSFIIYFNPFITGGPNVVVAIMSGRRNIFDANVSDTNAGARNVE
jgi:hypothetical protein